MSLQTQDSLVYAVLFPGGLSSVWNYLVYSIDYSSFQTTITQYVNTTVVSASTYPDIYFQDASISSLYLGKSSSSVFVGFLGQFAMSTDMSLPYTYMVSGGFTFFDSCPTMTVAGTCADCLATCTYGCISTTSCNVCYDPYCTSCTNSNSGSCQTCADYWWLFSDGNCYSCGPAQSAFEDVCYPSRGISCYFVAIGLECDICIGAYSYYLGFCVITCPTGTTSISNVCQGTTTALYLEFSGDLSLGTVQGFTSGYNSTNAYPEFDIADPVPVHNRGWFFSSNSSLSSSSIFLSPVFAIGLWIQIFSSGYIFSRQSGHNFCLFQDASGGINLEHTHQRGTFLMTYASTQVYSTWRYMSFTSSNEGWGNGMNVYMYLEMVNVQSGGISNAFYDEVGTGTFEIGSTSNAGFTGFLYAIEIYSIITPTFNHQTSCSGCSNCPLSRICLSACNVTQIDASPCGSCMATCTDGCVRTTDCYLCSEPLCYTCSSFTSPCLQAKPNTQTVSGVISCVSWAFLNTTNDCELCDQTCATCIGSADTQCTTCATGTRKFAVYGKCVPAVLCPTTPGGITQDLGSCTTSSAVIFSVTLNSLQNTFYDSASNIPVTSGNSAQFYPNYDIKDPWVADSRGYFFTGNSYLTISQGNPNTLLLGPELSIATWIYIYSDGLIFTRLDSTSTYFSLRAQTYLEFNLLTWLNTSVFLTQSTPVQYQSWMQIQIQIQITSYITIHLIANTFSGTHTDTLPSTDYLQDSPSASLIYGGSPGFVGYIWSINICNTFLNVPVTLTPACTHPTNLTSCISTCSIDQLPPSCSACSSDCTTGCNRINSCNLCHNYECETCSSLEVCTKCIGEATLADGVCACDAPRVFDLNVQRCELCYTNCEICTGMLAAQCLHCSSGYYSVMGYCMLCPIGYAVSEGYCSLDNAFVFSLELNNLDGVLYDTRNNITVLTGNSKSFYPNYDTNDPFAAYLRGYYFNGNSSMLKISQMGSSETALILGPIWTIKIWALPNSLSGCLISSISETSLMYSICMEPQHMILSIFLKEYGITSVAFLNSPRINSWNLISIGITFNGTATTAYYSINGNLDGSALLSGVHYINYFKETTTYFGSQAFTHFFRGFIYQVSIYSVLVTSPSRSLSDSPCVVQLNNDCIPECMIDSYWVGPDYNNCSACPGECLYGCRTNNTCSLCIDPMCGTCSQYNNSTCEACAANSHLDGKCTCNEGFMTNTLNQCVFCGMGQYFDGVGCSDCPRFVRHAALIPVIAAVRTLLLRRESVFAILDTEEIPRAYR